MSKLKGRGVQDTGFRVEATKKGDASALFEGTRGNRGTKVAFAGGNGGE